MAVSLEENIDFSEDLLATVFFKFHRFPWLQHLIILLIRLRDMINFQQYLKKPLRKDVDTMDNCHFRTLYRRSWFDDNFTDPDFLSALQLNTNLKFYNLDEAVGATSRVSLHLSVCILYFIMYHHLGHESITPRLVFQLSFSCAIVGYVILQSWRFWNERWNLATLMKISLVSDVLVAVGCGSFSYLFVPILRTVTTTMDIDTVHAVCAALFGVHLITNYYGIMTYCISPALSMNSALFSMICLSSRLQTDNHCLALLSFGVLSFICFPQFGRMMWEWPPAAGILICIVAYAGHTISPWLSLFIILLMFSVVVASPAMYIYYMQYKQNIQGPWDEATPDLNFDMNEIDRAFERRRKQAPPPRISEEQRKEEDEIARMEARGIGLPL